MLLLLLLMENRSTGSHLLQLLSAAHASHAVHWHLDSRSYYLLLLLLRLFESRLWRMLHLLRILRVVFVRRVAVRLLLHHLTSWQAIRIVLDHLSTLKRIEWW